MITHHDNVATVQADVTTLRSISHDLGVTGSEALLSMAVLMTPNLDS